MSYSWWKLPWLYFISHCLVEIYINILEHSINEWIKPPMCQNLVEISTKQWIHPLGIAIQCIYPLQFFIFHHPVDNSTNLGTSVGYATSVFHFPPSSGILHSYSTLFSDSVGSTFQRQQVSAGRASSVQPEDPAPPPSWRCATHPPLTGTGLHARQDGCLRAWQYAWQHDCL